MWFFVDLLLVGCFALVGRLNHEGSLSAGGWWSTAWPFLAGTLVAWAVLLLLRRGGGELGSGVAVWLGALVGGMVLRRLVGEGTALPFVVVATLVLGLLLVGARVLVHRTRRRTHRL
jgi:lipopolysaccharide export LptBFGC system permease protein LptF